LKSLLFFADVTENEYAVVQAAAVRLRSLLQTADSSAWTCDVRPIPEVEDFGGAPTSAIYILSLAKQLDYPLAPWDETAAAHRLHVKLLSTRGPKVLLLTVFRHVAAGDNPDIERDILVRIRRLNLLAIELSNEFGVSVADFDRDFADVGALPLATDFRLGGEAAKGMAAWALVRYVITNSLDGTVDFNLQDKILLANQSDRPNVDGVAYALHPNATRFGRRRRSQTVYAVPGGTNRGGAQLIAGALKGQVRLGEIWNRLEKAKRERRLLDFLLRLIRELVKITAGRRA
jgi:hypothetical protein